ncbi:phytoene desaturase family protein [Paenibacillus pasadenensis]|uniref:phytoene desaturase family protein n=1 Tax=Paenibacillus pasadenensis TaxID=217090 RepID=UPI00203C0DA1|nr:phytoene desaturase family protein [Paenibacillus pasadenensis]MCM3745886.1 phytoene desaturase family protein [Paenibacillus pasadenensis]
MGKKIIVVGGGLAGLAAAIRLRSDGHEVTVLEKNERAGGKLNIRSGLGYQFDTGPSILTMPWTLEKLFESAGRSLHDYVTLQRVEPQWRGIYEDGTVLDLTGDLPVMLEAIDSLSPADRGRFLGYLDYCRKQYDLCMKSFYSRTLSGLPDLRQEHSLRELLAMDPMKSVSQLAEQHLQHPHLRQIFQFFTMYIGSSPYAAPAVLSQLVYVQMGLGIYFVKGGMYEIARAELRLLEELGVPVRTGAEVTAIMETDGQASGVRLASGEELNADIVVCNLEAIPAHRSLLRDAPGSQRQLAKLAKYEPAVSGHVLLLGVNRSYDAFKHHNFFFSHDPQREFHEMFVDRIPTDDPTVYVGISSKSDPSQAPEGCENWFVLTHVPPLQPGESWEEHRSRYRELVLDKLERMGADNLRSHIVYENQFIPDDLQSLYGANGGSIYGAVTDRKLNGGFKIPSRSPLLEGLYFVGGSTHPGAGVPMVTLSGQLTADLIQEDLSQSEAM